MNKSYTQVYNGQWFRPTMKGFKEACCSCGLVHRVDYRVRKGKVEFRCWTVPRSTAMIRRHMSPEAWKPLRKYTKEAK